MENNRIDNLSDVSSVLENILQRINSLEREIALLKGENVPEEPAFDDSEAIDLSLDDMSFEEPAAAYHVAAEGLDMAESLDVPGQDTADMVMPEQDMPEQDLDGQEVPATDMPEMDIPEPEGSVQDMTEMATAEQDMPVSMIEESPEEDMTVEIADLPEQEVVDAAESEATAEQDDFSNLFGSEFDDVPQEKPKRGRRPSSASILNETSADSGKAVMDVLAEKSAWLHDLPGSEVKSLRSAIALGDQVLFIRRLFREDSALYQDTIDKLNSMTTLREAVRYIGETFPEWDTESDDVYKFMMAVRRRIRK